MLVIKNYLTMMLCLQSLNQFVTGSACFYSQIGNKILETECQYGCCSLNAKSPVEACCQRSNFFDIWFIPVLVIVGFVLVFTIIFLIYIFKYKNKSQKTSHIVPEITRSNINEIYTSDLSNTNNNLVTGTTKPQIVEVSTLPSYNEASQMRRNETLPQYNAVTPL